MNNRILGNGHYELVQSKNECCYQDVLDDFPNASEIFIVTYNISNKNEELLDLLKDIDEDVSISIITNIPNRFQQYFSSNNRNRARSNISVYLDELDTDKYNANASTYFNFNNHSKIIMTNNIAYIGSANYSSESSDNIECGLITRDTTIINQIRDNFVRAVEEESVRYNGTKLTRLEVLFMSFYTRLMALLDNILQGAMQIDDDNQLHYNFIDPYISLDDIENLAELIYEFQEIQNEWNEDELFLRLISDIDDSNIENILQICSKENELFELANFDNQNYSNNYLEDHALEADNEHLDEIIQDSCDSAAEIRQNLAENAETIFNEFYTNTTSFQENIEQIFERIDELKCQDSLIDNTND